MAEAHSCKLGEDLRTSEDRINWHVRNTEQMKKDFENERIREAQMFSQKIGTIVSDFKMEIKVKDQINQHLEKRVAKLKDALAKMFKMAKYPRLFEMASQLYEAEEEDRSKIIPVQKSTLKTEESAYLNSSVSPTLTNIMQN